MRAVRFTPPLLTPVCVPRQGLGSESVSSVVNVLCLSILHSL